MQLVFSEFQDQLVRGLAHRMNNILSLFHGYLGLLMDEQKLDPVMKDSHGIPAPRIDYRIGENTARMMEHGIAHAKEILAAAEATDICVNSPILYGGWHLLGTARMGADPARSVVNEWGRSHDVKNLFIVDGSLFVTSGGVNPTSTIQALALYIADQMKQRLANLFD